MSKHGEHIRVGKTFGKFTVIEAVGLRGGQHHWICRCECGRTMELSRHVLRSGAKQDCGCSKVKPKKKRENLTGQKFNRLTVLGTAQEQDGQGPLWECACSCGGRKTVRGHELKRGVVKSCGCMRRRPLIDLTGQTFGKLTVLSRAENFHGSTMWNCRCECGTERAIRSWALIHGETRTCGCARFEKTEKKRKPRFKNITGKVFGKLTALRRLEKPKGKKGLWLCRCECGGTREANYTELNIGRVEHCGCQKANCGRRVIDLTGKKFGRLKVVARDETPRGNEARKNAAVHWNCVCECGTLCSVPSVRLRSGLTRSCGCLRDRPPETSVRNLFKNYRRGAEKRDYEFILTEDQFRKIVVQNCFYCGAPPTERRRKKKTYDGFAFNGVDRINNAKGYSLDNCVAACKTCNAMKATYTPAFFLKHIKAIYQNKFQKKSKSKIPDKTPNQQIIEF